jgi:thiol-disulfide isomerase/thioredoxin
MCSSSTTTRKILLALAACTLAFASPKSAKAQSQPQAMSQAATANAASSAQNGATQSVAPVASAQADDSAQSDQPMSLGDLARMARAQKAAAAKAVRVIDDENMPRGGGGINVVGDSSGGGSGGGFAGGGKMTLLDFWASWCGPCRESVPDLKALQRAYGSDLEVVSVNEDKNENAGRSFASENGMNWNVEYDPQGTTARDHGVNAFPTFILLDSEGHEVQRFIGEDSSDPLANRIAPFLKKAPKGTT